MNNENEKAVAVPSGDGSANFADRIIEELRKMECTAQRFSPRWNEEARAVVRQELAEALGPLHEIAQWAYNMGYTPQWMSRDEHFKRLSPNNEMSHANPKNP